MKKIIPILAFFIALSASVFIQGAPRRTVYYRWSASAPTVCIIESECNIIGPFTCDHMTFAAGVLLNCENQILLRKF